MSSGARAAVSESGRATKRRHSVFQPFEVLRERLLVWWVLAASVLIVSATANAWRNQQAIARAALGQAQTQIAATMARHDAVLNSLRGYLSAVGALPELNSPLRESCDRVLRQAWLLRPGKLSALETRDSDGRAQCAVTPTGSLLPDFVAALANRVVVRLTDGRVVLTIAEPRGGGGSTVGAAVVDWLGDPISGIWFLEGNQMLPLGNAPTGMRPRSQWFAQRQPSEMAFVATGQDGMQYAYATEALGGQLRLLVAMPLNADLSAAGALVLQGFAVLPLLLVLALTGIALGAHRAHVEPIKHLASAVRRWQSGAPFEGAPKASLPRELAELSCSFAQATQTLAERERQLRNAVVQQDLLMQEIHHRVKNNLQIVASLLNLQASRIRQPEARREFQSARDRIRSLATLHRHLYANGDLHTINMRGFLQELCSQLLQALGESEGERIRLTIEASELHINSDQAVPMALIVTEVVSNAAKYAFPGQRVGHIAVRLTTDGVRAHLMIRDDGVGLPASPSRRESERSDGIGLHLIHGFARQLGAELVVTHEGGTCYDLWLIMRRERVEEMPPV